MIAFRYTKTDGAEYISHLDLLRHIDRILRRAGIEVGYSQGFHKHPRIFMGNPLALGVKSVSEYCTVDAATDKDFAQLFNRFSPEGVKCLAWKNTEQNPNFAESIKACRYEATGLAHFDAEEILSQKEIIITDMRGRTVDIRPRIYGIEWHGDKLVFTLCCGEKNLRPDLMCSYLKELYGGEAKVILKTDSFGDSVF